MTGSLSMWWDSAKASGAAMRESARQRALDAAWLGQSIAELCATAEAFERLVVALVPALLDGRLLAGGLGGAEARRLALDLARSSRTLVTLGYLMAGHQQQLRQLGQEDWRALLWLSHTAAKAVHAWLALPPAQLLQFDPEGGSSIWFTPCRASGVLACQVLGRQAASAVEQR